MDPAAIIQNLVVASPFAALCFYLWWTERKERVTTQNKYETFLRENADRLLAFADEQRKSMAIHDESIKELMRHVRER